GTPVASGLEGDAIADDAGVSPSDDILVALEYTQRLPAPSSTSTDLRAVRLEGEGSRPAGWPDTGLVVCGAPGVQRQVRLFRQGSGRVLPGTAERTGAGATCGPRALPAGP